MLIYLTSVDDKCKKYRKSSFSFPKISRLNAWNLIVILVLQWSLQYDFFDSSEYARIFYVSSDRRCSSEKVAHCSEVPAGPWRVIAQQYEVTLQHFNSVKELFTHKHAHTHTQHMSVPSVRMVKGESPSLLAENCPPREVIRKHRLKKPIPTTNILQHRRRKEGIGVKGVEID